MSIQHNYICLVGNLTRDPELRHTPDGVANCRLGLASDWCTKNSEGKRNKETIFIDVEAWTHDAEFASQFLTKGSRVLVEGQLRQATWEDKDTKEKRSKIYIKARTVQAVDKPEHD